MPKSKSIHIGKLIKQKLGESNLSIAEFARQIDCHRTNVYKIWEQRDIDVYRLLKISQVLKHDFIAEINSEQPSLTCKHQSKCMFFEPD